MINLPTNTTKYETFLKKYRTYKYNYIHNYIILVSFLFWKWSNNTAADISCKKEEKFNVL